MARILLAVDFEIEARLLEGIIRRGHDIVDRVTGADAVVEAAGRLRPDLALLQAGPETLTARSLAACDGAGTRTIALIAGDLERRNAASLGVVDRIEAHDDWDAVETLIAPAPFSAPAATAKPAITPVPEAVLDESVGWRPEASSIPAAPAAPEQPSSRRDRRDRESRRRSERREQEQAARSEQAGLIAESQQLGAGIPPAEPRAPRRAVLAPQSPAAHPRQSTVIAVWGPYGAPGRTTIATGLAGAYAEAGHRVLLIDADTYGGAIAPLLGIADEAPGFAAACRLAGAESLNVAELDRVASTAGKQGPFRVLSGISNPARWPELGRDRVRGTLATCRAFADVVIVDVGFNLETDEELLSDVVAPRRNAATLAVLENCDAVVAVAEATPVGIPRFLRARMQLIDRIGTETPVATVANRVRSAATGVDAAGQVRQALRRFGGIEDAVLLPDDPKACDRALSLGVPVVEAAPRSVLTRHLRQLAMGLVAVP